MTFEREQDRAIVFTRRAVFVGVVQASILGVLGTRMGWLQIVEGEKYRTLAEENRINVRMITPSRGRIVDRFGVPLADTTRDFRVMVVPEQTKDLKKALQDLGKFIPLSERDMARVLKEAARSPAYAPLMIRDNLDWDAVATVEVNLPDLPGMAIDEGQIRSYPFTDATCHLIGYVGVPSEAEVRKATEAGKNADPLLSQPGFRIGKSGLEKSFETSLRGQPGTQEVEVNVVGRAVRTLSSVAATPGHRLVLSIDAELQRFAQKRMAEQRSASSVLMDVETGAVYALASYPAFDPNNFTRGIPTDKWEELLADPTKPLSNKAVAGLYPPGSTFKMMTALAALEAGVIDEHTSVFCPGHFMLGNTKFHCWKKGGHGTVSVVSALMHSCDTFFYKISSAVGIERIAEMARRFGLGQKLDFDLREERAGTVPDRAWKRATYDQPWHPGETVNASIGQGYLQSSPLQLAVMTARLANGGRAVKPWVVAYDGTRPAGPVEGQDWPDMGISRKNLNLVLTGMNNVVNVQGGTAYAARISEPGKEMAGKTGTAQVKRITMWERQQGIKNEDLAWHFRHHALFVAYAPVVKPRYACAVVVEHGSAGSTAAAPIARDILIEAQKRDPASAPFKI